MSSEEIDWGKVSKVLVKTLGTEAARGLLYAFMSQTAYPLLVNAVASLATRVQKGEMSEEEAIRALREELNRLKAQGAIPQQPPPSSEADLERKIAEILEKRLPQLQPATPQAQQAPQLAMPQAPQAMSQPQAQPPALISTELKEIEGELQNLKSIRAEIMRKLYTTTDEKERDILSRNLNDVENKIKELELKRERMYLTMARA
ncbi:hypothetical protein [Infirmifilum sp. NZ]|uniref:hypothetical protein n=1 Tax=Infirmifilum sp. NZ TaxID=2926850 RepID=UPI0027A96243|nr:hypothetical protein [Infirmifilum sp. NZ]UNQ73388.1 hypothetical protein MOV14_09790 [Infirmifilum sp. NZ]